MEENNPQNASKSSSSSNKQLVKKKVNEPNRSFRCLQCEYQTKQAVHLQRHMIQHENNFPHQCPLCTYSARSRNKISSHTTRCHNIIENPDEWYTPPCGYRKKYLSCPNCNYKTLSNIWMMRHIRKQHPSSAPFQNDADESAYCLSKGWALCRCTYCDFTTPSHGQFKRHMKRHVEKSAHQCYLCNYSACTNSILAHHLNKHHKRGVKNTSHADEEAPSATSLKNEEIRGEKIQFGLRECSVILEDIGPAYFISEPTRSSSSKRERKFQSLRIRVEVMENKVRIADEEMRNLSCKKNDVTDKFQEIAALKEKIENDLRAEKCEALELTKKRNQLSKLEGELLTLREEEEHLTEELGIAEGSFIGATQVLFALQSDLKDLESD